MHAIAIEHMATVMGRVQQEGQGTSNRSATSYGLGCSTQSGCTRATTGVMMNDEPVT